MASEPAPTRWIGLLAAVGTGVGAALYTRVDPVAYLQVVRALLSEGGIYSVQRAAYPPLFYWLAAAVLAPLKLLGLPLRPSLAAMGALAALQVVPLAGAVAVAAGSMPRRRARWFGLVVLAGPLTLATLAWGQADVLVAAPVLGALVAIDRNRWTAVGGLAAVGAALKVYPILLVVPVLIRRPEARRGVLGGVVGVGGVLATASLLAHPGLLPAAFDGGHRLGIYAGTATGNNHPLSLFRGVVGTAAVEAGAPIAAAAAVGLGVVGAVRAVDVPAAGRSILPVAAAVLFHPGGQTYRWVPVVVGLAYVGYAAWRPRWRWVAWWTSVLGGVRLLGVVAFQYAEGIEAAGFLQASAGRWAWTPLDPWWCPPAVQQSIGLVAVWVVIGLLVWVFGGGRRVGSGEVTPPD